jgi:acetyl esterase/lipase
MRWFFSTALFLASATLSAQAPKLPDAPEGSQTSKDVSYGPHERNKLDITVPKSDKPLPLVIWVHGGGWEAGDKAFNPGAILLSQEYAVASINYRYSKQAVFPAQLHDCKAAVRFLRDNAKKYNLDPNAFGVWGASAGGHLVALLGTTGDVPDLEGDAKTTTSSKVQAVCDWFGPTDLVKLAPRSAASSPITKLLGGSTTDKADLATLANPVTHITKNDAPFLTFHGDADRLVPVSQSELLHAALTKAGVESEFVLLKGADHGGREFQAQVGNAENRKKLVAFLDRHLKMTVAK